MSLPLEQLLKLPPADLADLLLVALEAQQQATENCLALASRLAECEAAKAVAEDKALSLEAELIALRNRT